MDSVHCVVCQQNHRQQRHATVITVLALATLGGATEVGTFLFVSYDLYGVTQPKVAKAMEQCALKIVSNCSNTNIYSYLDTSGGQSYNMYLNVVHFFNTSLD
jgi:hypothetical protein